MARIHLKPHGASLTVADGTPLSEALFSHGVEFPCGGAGRCGRCRCRDAVGVTPILDIDRDVLGDTVKEGWRLACRHHAHGEVTLEVGQWQAQVLGDERKLAGGGTGFGIAVDIGTTTLVAQLVDLAAGTVVAVESGLNPQGRHGADVMSRVQFACAGDGLAVLQSLIRSEIGGMCARLMAQATAGTRVDQVVLVGNTAMHHLFGGLDPKALAFLPFHPAEMGMLRYDASDLGWNLPGARVRFLPVLGGFVGSDILAGILATGLHEADADEALVDLGTNGEIVVGCRDGLRVAATAAGPAFEGACISIGMRAATGAITAITRQGEGIACRIAGGGLARGICGSGLVDAAVMAREFGALDHRGRLKDQRWALVDGLAIIGADIRQLQLAKGAVLAGIDMLTDPTKGIRRLHLAGAFGNYINRDNAVRVGLLPGPVERIEAVGNTALAGAKLALLRPDDDFAWLQRLCRHVALHEDSSFEERYADAMAFP